MPRKRKKVKIEQNIEEGKPSKIWLILGFALLFLGCTFAGALFSWSPDDTLNLAYKVETVLFGKMAFVLPMLLLAIGFKLLLKKEIGCFNKKIWGAGLMLLCLLGLCHLYFTSADLSNIEAYQAGGGIVGYMLVKLVGGFVGDTATGIMLGVGFLFSILMIVPLEILMAVLVGLKDKLFGSSEEDDHTKKNYSNTKSQADVKTIFKDGEASYRADSNGLNPRDIYNSSEFGSFNEGIKKESAYKKVISFAKPDAMRKVQHQDPIQIPEWEESNPNKNASSKWTEKKNISQGRIIHWEDLAREQERKINKEQVSNSQDEEYAIGTSASEDSVITNFYKEEEKEPLEANRPNAQAVKSEIFPLENAGNEPVAFENIESETEKTGSIETSENEKTRNLEALENEKTVGITIEDSADKIEGVALTEAEAKARERSEKEEQANKVVTQSKYVKPPVALLNPPVRADRASWEQGVKEQCTVLEKTLADFKVRARVINVTRGPSVTRFELEPAPGVKVASIVNLADDIALRLAASGVRIEAPIPGKSAVGIEAPNLKNDMVAFREVVDTDVVKNDPSRLAIGLGKNISGDIISADLGKMPHTLIAGSTGSGKSVCVNTIIAGLLYKASPEEVKLILVDPKVVELSNYNGIPHLLTPVVTDPKKAASALRWGVNEMERRYQLFADNHVREITAYNKKDDVEKIPYIVIIIDELADLMMVAKVDVEEAILRLAQKARACGIHLILATQRPSVDVITGIVKANIPSRVAFAVSSQTDSRTILDGSGAEKLLGKGDMLFKPVGVNTPMRVQGAFVTDEELSKIVDFVKQQGIATEYNEEVTNVELSTDKDKASAQEASSETGNNGPEEDALFADALRLVLDTGQVSSSMLQRRFRIGYTRAARLVDTFEELGIVGQSLGAKPREVIMSRQEVEERFLNH